MKRFSHWVTVFKKRPYISAVGAVILLLGAWTVFGNGNGSNFETIVIESGDFTATISIAGNVVAAKEVDLGFSQSGRVTGVYASVGDRVTQGKTLAHIENGDLFAALSSARAKLAAAQEGTRPEEILIAESELESDTAALLDQIRNAYRVADDSVRTKTAELFSNPRTSPILTFITESSSAKRAAQDEHLSLEKTLVTWEKEVGSLTTNSNLGAAAERAHSVLGEVAGFLFEVSSALNSAEIDAYTTQDDINAYTANITTARANVNAAQSSLNSALADRVSSEKNLALKRAGSRPSDINIESAAVQAAQAELAKTIITAPFSGIITVMDARVGEIISPNTPEISMISEGAFQIESYIPEVIIAQVQVGDTATVYLDAYGASVPFEASVVSIDPAETEREGVSTYKTLLQFTSTDARIRPGMTANITVTTEEKAQTIVIPQGALIKRGEQAFVYVLEGENAVERQVTTGLSSVGQIEILSGLNQGDVLVLNPS